MTSLTFSTRSVSCPTEPYRVCKFVPPDGRKWKEQPQIGSHNLMGHTVIWCPEGQSYKTSTEFIRATFTTKANWSVKQFYNHIVKYTKKAYPLAIFQLVFNKERNILFTLYNSIKGQEAHELRSLIQFGKDGYFSLRYLSTNPKNIQSELFWEKCAHMLGNVEYHPKQP